MFAKERVLKEIFGFNSFRPSQSEAIDSLFDPNTQGVLVILPTAGGKSLLYQLPALMFNGLTIVVSPLISLMKDQVDYLRSRRIPVEFYNSSLSEFEKRTIEQKIANHEPKLLYVAPERFSDGKFMQLLKQSNCIDLLAVDEAHCISVWGHDFRPSYRMIKDAIHYLEPKRIIALTATATKHVQQDICDQLDIPNAKRIIYGFYRPDLKLNVKYYNSSSRIEKVVSEVSRHVRNGDNTGIIYCPTKRLANAMYLALSNEGIVSTVYHAGLSDSVREKTQSEWSENGGIIVATVAFGMGIDKPDVRFVMHVGLPSSIENYYQEIGRASRDGKGATCTLYFDSYSDISLQKFFIDLAYPTQETIESFWEWCCETADSNGLILMTQEEMASKCRRFVEEHCVPGCINKLRENQFIETIGRGKYRINTQKQLNSETFDFDKLNQKREARLTTLSELVEYANNKKHCRMLQILDYFNDYSRDESCGKCDVCVQRMLKTKPV